MPGSRPYVAPGGYETGFEFRTKGGARAATVSGAVSNIMQSISRMKQQAEDRKRTEAQNIMSVLLRAYENPDDPVNKRIIQTIMNDPKKQKVLREIYGSVAEAMKPGETSPEAVGAQQAVKEAQQREQQGAAKTAPAAQAQPQPLFMTGTTPQARAGAEQARTAEMSESVKQQMMQQGRGPEMIGASVFTPEEQRSMATRQFEAAIAGMEAKQQSEMVGLMVDVYKANLAAGTQLKVATSDQERARIMAGPAYARVDVMKKAVEGRFDNDALRFVMSQNGELESEINFLRREAASARAAAVRETDDDRRKSLNDKADAFDGQADTVSSRKATIMDLVMAKRLAHVEAE